MTTAFKPYPKYKPSGVEWLGDIPEHWETCKVKKVTKFWTGWTPSTSNQSSYEGDNLWANISDLTTKSITETAKKISDEAVSEMGLCPSPVGSLLFSFKLSVGAVSFAGAELFTNEAIATFPPSENVCLPYAYYAFPYFIPKNANENIYGAKLLNQTLIRSAYLVLPTPDEQATIAAFLDSETAKIDEIDKGLDDLVALANEEVSSMVFSGSKTKEMRLSWATEEVSRPLHSGASGSFTKIGLFNRGRGLFHKDPSEADEMGDSDFFFVEEGDCIISGQFAWEGAVALADKEDTGCVVSHRYPVIRGKEGVALTEYIYALLCSTHGNFLLNDHSRGAAGRNRPLNIGTLLKEKVAIPDMVTQERVAKAVRKKKEVLKEVKAMKTLLDEYRASLIHEAVTGKIDLRKV